MRLFIKPERKQSAPPPVEARLVLFPFLKVIPVTLNSFTVIIKTLLKCWASNITSSFCQLTRFNFLLITKFVLFSPVYVPPAI